eukprot:4486978-Amphidinium_carterae.1
MTNATAPPPATAQGVSKLLALRLIYGNPSAKDLASASCQQPKPVLLSSFSLAASSFATFASVVFHFYTFSALDCSVQSKGQTYFRLNDCQFTEEKCIAACSDKERALGTNVTVTGTNSQTRREMFEFQLPLPYRTKSWGINSVTAILAMALQFSTSNVKRSRSVPIACLPVGSSHFHITKDRLQWDKGQTIPLLPLQQHYNGTRAKEYHCNNKYVCSFSVLGVE